MHTIAPQRREIARVAYNDWLAMPTAPHPPTSEAETFLTYNRWQAELRYLRLRNWSLRAEAFALEEYVSQYGIYIGYELADVYDLWTEDLYRVGMETWADLVPTFEKKCVKELLFRLGFEVSQKAFVSVGTAARDKLLRRPPTPAAPAASGGVGKTAGKYIKDCLKGVVIDSMVNAIVPGAKQNWIRFRENEGIYREVGEYWWDHFIMTTVSRTVPEETFRQFGNHVKRQLKEKTKDAVTEYRVQAHVREMAQNFISGLPDDIAGHPEIQRAARERAQAELSGEALKEFRKQARDSLGTTHSWMVKSELEFLLQELDVIDFARKVIGEKLSVYWVNSSEWTRYGPEQIKRYKDIIDCLKKKEEKVGPGPVLVHLRLAEDSYRDFIRECRTTKDGKETAAEVRARELEEARKLLEEVDALQAALPSHLGIALTEFEADVADVDRAVDQKEADFIPFLEDPAVRCDPPSDAAAAFRAKADGTKSEVQGLAALRDQAGGYRDQACESLERAVVQDATRLARHTADQAGQTATTVSAAIAALIQEGEQADPGARLRAFSVDDIRETFDRVTGELKARESDFEAVSAIENEATTKIQRGQWLTGRWYDSESKSLERTFNDRENVMIKYINTRDEYRALFETMDASARQIERTEADKEAALACVATLYPLDDLRQRSASVPLFAEAADAAATEAEACLDGFDNHKVMALLRQCKLAEAEKALGEMDRNNPTYGLASAHVGREKSAREHLASAQKLWMDRDIGGDYRKYGAAYDILKGAQEPPAPCPDTQAALASALKEIERLLAGADASSEPARAEKARGHLVQCRIAEARETLGPDFPRHHSVWTEISAREQNEGQARALYADAKAVLAGGDGDRLAQLAQAQATLATASRLDICDKTRDALERAIAKLRAREVQVRAASAREQLAACNFEEARALIAPIGADHPEHQAILASIEDEKAVRASYAEVREQLAAPGVAKDAEALRAIRGKLAGLQDRTACDKTRETLGRAVAAVDGALDKATATASADQQGEEETGTGGNAATASRDAVAALRACQWQRAAALIGQLGDTPERQAKLQTRLDAEQRWEAYLGEPSYQSGVSERSARLGEIAGKSLCERNRQAAASARESMLTTYGEDAVKDCDPRTAQWAASQLGSGPGFQRINTLLDKERQAKASLAAYDQARAAGKLATMREAAIGGRDNAVCRGTQSAASANVEDYNRRARQAAAAPQRPPAPGGGSTPYGSAPQGSGTGATADPRCAALERDMHVLGDEAKRLSMQIRSVSQSGQGSADQIRDLQGRLMATYPRLQDMQAEYRQRRCDQAAYGGTDQCQQLLNAYYAKEREFKGYQASLMRCGNNPSCVTSYQQALRNAANETQALASRLNSQCKGAGG